jgi:hypothetical protein
MENTQDLQTQVRKIILELAGYPFSQIFDILPIEKTLREMEATAPQSIEILIGQMFAAVLLGKPEEARALGERIWKIGGNLAQFYEIVYTDCLLNIGEIDKAGILLNDRLHNIGGNLQNFYTPMVKFALLSGNLRLLKNIGEYPNVYQQEAELFDFANHHTNNLSERDYKAVLQIVLTQLKNVLCAFDYVMYNDGQIEFLLYTTEGVDQNADLLKLLEEKFSGYFTSMQEPPLHDLSFKLLNIKLHPSWMNPQA